MPVVFRKGRYRFFFFSNENGEPIHIHVASGDQYAKFWREPIELASSSGYRTHELNEIRRSIMLNAELIRKKWHEHIID